MADSNAASGLLSPEENTSVWDILKRAHRKNQSLATAVAKLYVTEPETNHRRWVERVTGVVCLVKDYIRKSYFIQLIDMDYHQQVWEQELYLEFVYKSTTQRWFHMFESEHGVAGLSFADEREGDSFRSMVENKLMSRRPGSQSGQQHSPATLRQAQLNNNQVTLHANKPAPLSGGKTKSGKKKLKKINKIDISGPDTSSFIHVSGAKMSAGGGMEMVDNSNLIDPRTRKFLTIAGIDANKLSSEDIKKAEDIARKEDIYGKIDKIDRRERRRTINTGPGQPKPPGLTKPPRLAPVTEAQTVKPRPPPTRKNISSPPPPPRQGKVKGSTPPPPPPPPSGGGPPPPPPPPPLPSLAVPGGGPPPPPKVGKPPPARTPSPANPRGDMLADIRRAGGKAGAGLRPVGERTSATSDDTGPKDFTALLAGALETINTAAGLSSSSDDDEEDDDDWDEDDEWESTA